MSPRLTIAVAVLAGGLAGVIGAGLTRGEDSPDRVVTVITERSTTTERAHNVPYVPDDSGYGSNAGREAVEEIEVPQPQTTPTTYQGAVRCGYRATDPVGCYPADDPVWDIADELARRDMQESIDCLDRKTDFDRSNDPYAGEC